MVLHVQADDTCPDGLGVSQGLWPFGSFVRDTLVVPYASLSTGDLGGIMTCAGSHPCSWWDYIDKNNTRTPHDDQYERKSR